MRLAYDTGRGNPFAKYDLSDFTSDDISLDNSQGVDLVSMTHRVGDSFSGGVELQLTITDEEWETVLSGFEPNRDIVVNMQEVN